MNMKKQPVGDKWTYQSNEGVKMSYREIVTKIYYVDWQNNQK